GRPHWLPFTGRVPRKEPRSVSRCALRAGARVAATGACSRGPGRSDSAGSSGARDCEAPRILDRVGREELRLLDRETRAGDLFAGDADRRLAALGQTALRFDRYGDSDIRDAGGGGRVRIHARAVGIAERSIARCIESFQLFPAGAPLRAAKLAR